MLAQMPIYLCRPERIGAFERQRSNAPMHSGRQECVYPTCTCMHPLMRFMRLMKNRLGCKRARLIGGSS